MNLSQEQVRILKIFYENKKISISTLNDYKIDKNTSVFKSMEYKGLLKLSDPKPGMHPVVGMCNLHTAYRITTEGEAIYENLIKQETLEQEQLNLQRRDTIAVEQTVETAKEANDISKDANKIALDSKNLSILAIIISALGVVSSIIIGICSYLSKSA